MDHKQLKEPYVQHQGSAYRSQYPELETFGPVNIPQGKLFVMGDNRDISMDSRMSQVGLIDISEVRGKELYVMGNREKYLNFLHSVLERK